MKLCLITNEFYPTHGGVAKTFTNMCKAFKGRQEKLYIFNYNYKGKNIFNILHKSKKRYNFKDLLLLCKKKSFLLFLIRSFWKITLDKEVKFYFRLNMVLYLLIKPHVLIHIVKNLSLINPYIKTINPDLVLVSACGNIIMPLGYILSRVIKKKCICWGHGDDILVRSRYSLKTYYLRSFDRIVLSCNKMKDLIKRVNHLTDDKLTIIHRGLYPSDFVLKEGKKELREALNIPDNEFVLISVGRHATRKNFQIVIKAMKKIKEIYPHLNIKYFLLGEGPETQNLKDLTKKLRLEEEVIFIGAVDDKMKNKYLKASDIFVTPSISTNKTIEGFGIVFLEANFFKIPVIGTMSGGITEAIEHKKSGLLIKPNDLTELVEAIIYLYEHEEERNKMGEYGYKRVINDFNWESLINEYINLFKKTIRQNK
ncbi:MAG: glycosyltransferase family 4 protein [Promethearchaeota archaeon]